MAKLLGQEIVTQAEFDQFKMDTIEAQQAELLVHRDEILNLKLLTARMDKSLLLSKIAIFLSVAALIGMGLQHFAK